MQFSKMFIQKVDLLITVKQLAVNMKVPLLLILVTIG